MSLEERVDQLTTLLMVARTDIRKLQAQFDDLVCKRQRENSQGDCDENQPPVKKKRQPNYFYLVMRKKNMMIMNRLQRTKTKPKLILL